MGSSGLLFTTPRLQAQAQANTFVVTGRGEEHEQLPMGMSNNQLAQQLQQLKKEGYSEEEILKLLQQQMKNVSGGDLDGIPNLDSNFDNDENDDDQGPPELIEDDNKNEDDKADNDNNNE